MIYNYIALVVFSLLAIFIPTSFILTSRILRKKSNINQIKTSPYECGEISIGSSMDVDIEYFPFMILFLPFEIMGIIILIWSISESYFSYYKSVEVLILLFISILISIIGYKYISKGN